MVKSSLRGKAKSNNTTQVQRKIPAATSVTNYGRAPKYVAADNGVTISNREFVKAINGTSAFTPHEWSVNAAVGTLFPMLSGIARNYEQYRFRNIAFHWFPIAGTDRDGHVGIAFNPDATCPIPLTKMDMYSMSTSALGPLYSTDIVVRASGGGGKILYCRSDITEEGDLKTTDFGKFFLSTADCESASVMGELFVSYTVELKYPRRMVQNPLMVESVGASTGGDVLDYVYNGNADQSHLSTHPVHGQDLAYFNSSSNFNYIYFRRPGTYHVFFSITKGSAAGSPFYFSAGGDTLVHKEVVADGSGVGVCTWNVWCTAKSAGDHLVSSATCTDPLLAQSFVTVTEVGAATAKWLDAL